MTHHHEHHGHKHNGHDHGAMVADFRKRFWISMALTLPVLFLSPMLQGWTGLEEALAFPGDMFVLFGLSTLIFVYGGKPFLKGGYNELRGKQPGMMTLIGLAIATAYGYSSAVAFGFEGKVFFWELASLIDIMLLGHWVEMKSVMGASAALEKLAELLPDTAARLKESGETEDVPVSELKSGDKIQIRPGEKMPADGTIVKGSSSINEAMLTGESAPVRKGEGDAVIGGAINGEGGLTVEVAKTGDETFLSGVINLVRSAQESKSRTQDIANRAAFWLTIIALSVGALTLAGWLSLSTRDFAFAMERTVTVMVITCPHALGLAVPLVVAVTTAIGAKNGLLIRNRPAFENARNVQAVVFDKTGTLTRGEFGISDIVPFGKTDAKELLRLAAGVEQGSEHPIAVGIMNHAKENDIDVPEATDFTNITGQGAKAEIEGKDVAIVSPAYAEKQGAKADTAKTGELTELGKTVVILMIDGKAEGALAMADIVRDEAKAAIARLHAMNIETIMLTGDNQKVAENVAKELGIDEVITEVLPDQKSDKIKEIQSRGLITAMTGDGVNDAPALAQADVGIAIGAGTDVAIETADIVLVRSNPEDVVAIIGLARATYRKMLQNLAWATGYNLFAIPLATGAFIGWGIVLSPAMGAVLMSLSTVICAANARMLKLPGHES